MANVTKKQKIEKYKNNIGKLRLELAVILTAIEMYPRFYIPSGEIRQHLRMLHRRRRKLSRKIDSYERKLESIRGEMIK